MGCLQFGNLSLCSAEPMERIVVGRTRSKKWCFKCRKHAVHLKVNLCEVLRYTDDGQLINGWYGPVSILECPTCKQDNTLFPSWSW